MQQRKVLREGRPRTAFLSWFLSSSKKEPQDSAKIEIEITETDVSPLVPTPPIHHQIEIPDRRQSQLYTIYHNPGQELQINVNKRRSFYACQPTEPDNAPSTSCSSSSSLTRSATWQPSSNNNTHSNNDNETHLQPADIIPARRTSRNYSEDPEIQAKLNAVLNSERTFHLSHILRENNPNRQIQTNTRMPT
ncbi:hypothetical protein BD560DRAFT_439072 [Blakeslea trispora]|nr:hypothetical protein BD560DRAFT_439072 [Blakeslea trispora]